MLNKNIREKFLKYYPDEDLQKWFDPLVLSCEADPKQADGLLSAERANSASNELYSSATKIRVKFPHALFADWFSLKYKDKFETTLRRCFSPKAEISYACSGSSFFQTPKFKPTVKVVFSTSESADKYLGSDYLNNSARNDSFDNFLFNKKNQFPVAAAQKFASGLGYPLFILTGASGHGKSHLLHAIYNQLSESVPKKYLFFSNLDYLVTLFTEAAKKNESPLIYFRDFQYIIIDDLDSATEPEIRETLARLLEYAQDRQIGCAVSLRHKPGDSSMLNDKLRSVLEGGLIIELKKPDLDIRRQYVDKLSKSLNLQVKKDDALALARMYSDFRQIYGAFLKVSEFKVLSPQAAEAKLADILQASFVQTEAKLTPDHIIATVAAHLQVSAAEVTGKARKQKAVFARHVSMYLCRELLGAQLGHIGACFSDRDHSSVLYSVNKIKSIIRSDKDTNNLVTELKNLCLK